MANALQTTSKDKRVNILGILFHPATLENAVTRLVSRIETCQPGCAHFCTVHSIMAVAGNKGLKRQMNRGLAFTDGMPLVCLSRWFGYRGAGRVYGPDLMLAMCQYGVNRKYRHYFYGGGPGIAETLANALRKKFPEIEIAGFYTPPLLAPGEMEKKSVIDRINAAGPDVVWVGLGAPKQDIWIINHRPLLNAPVLAAVGAAFDFHSGKTRQAPPWMQKSGMEWLFRLLQEPRRLMVRYLIYNPLFIIAVLLQITGLRRYGQEDRP